LLFPGKKTRDVEGKKISPNFQTEAKAEAFALEWMKKNTAGTNQPHS
jgi:hypothetical protein